MFAPPQPTQPVELLYGCCERPPRYLASLPSPLSSQENLLFPFFHSGKISDAFFYCFFFIDLEGARKKSETKEFILSNFLRVFLSIEKLLQSKNEEIFLQRDLEKVISSFHKNLFEALISKILSFPYIKGSKITTFKRSPGFEFPENLDIACKVAQFLASVFVDPHWFQSSFCKVNPATKPGKIGRWESRF